MNGTNRVSSGTIPYSAGQPNWRITASGDFGSSSDYSSGAKDDKTDLLLTYYNPAGFVSGTNHLGIWFMDGLTNTLASTVKISGTTNDLVVPNPDWRAVATGSFNPSTNSTTDVLIRHATYGQQGAWYLTGIYYVGAWWKKPEPDPAMKLYGQDWYQSTWRHNDIYPSISATPSSGNVILNFRIRPYSTYGMTIRRRADGSSWSTLETNWTPSAYTNTFTLTNGVRYEYEVYRNGDISDSYPTSGNYPSGNSDYFPARVVTGINFSVTNMENRGKLLVIVDNTVYSSITNSLSTFTDDLVGDGWSVVLKTDAPRHDDTTNSCSGFPKTDPAADSTNSVNKSNLKSGITSNHSDAKGLILLGHVTVPFSDVNGVSDSGPPDGHTNHWGAWVADMWYGDMATNAIWSDTRTNIKNCTSSLIFAHNYDIPSDGKFDSPYGPTNLAMFVGRIDFARLPTFGTGDSVSSAETTLLTRYLAKDHAYRTKTTQ